MSLLRALYAFAIFLASCLLFLMEPMAAKRLLPLFGGSAAVWTTCLVFFQTALLLGYVLAHALATRGGVRQQSVAYLTILGSALVATLITPAHLEPDLAHPALSVFALLAGLIGLPFIALSASSPLLQAWYARALASGADLRPPYRLFVLSNFGSLAALASYPSLIEPHSSLDAQMSVWRGGLALYAALCALLVWRSRAGGAVPASQARFPEEAASLKTTVLWLCLAACGSVLLCAVTAHLSQNIAAIPLLWVVPLTLYLLSFMITFQGGAWYPRRSIWLALAVVLAALGYLLWADVSDLGLAISLPLFCGSLLIACIFCHAELYRLRPAARDSTRFYLCIAAGGAAGAVFVGIVAPLAFAGDYELCCALLLTAILALTVSAREGLAWRALWSLMTLAIALASFVYVHTYGEHSLAKVRNFYGALRVTEEGSAAGRVRTLYNGTIEHGAQWLDGALRSTATTYYASDSGVGLALDLCCSERARRVGIIGLGAGTLAVYGRRGDLFRFYEINPLVEPIAHSFFSYLGDSHATIEVVPGDARVSLMAEPSQEFDVLVVDAFSGDAIPVHLLTAEAVTLYRHHLRAGGIIAFHVSNKYLELAPVVRAQAAHAGLQALEIDSDDDDSRGELSADWVLVTDDARFLAQPALQADRVDIAKVPGLRLWTDGYNSLLPLLKWGGGLD